MGILGMFSECDDEREKATAIAKLQVGMEKANRALRDTHNQTHNHSRLPPTVTDSRMRLASISTRQVRRSCELESISGTSALTLLGPPPSKLRQPF